MKFCPECGHQNNDSAKFCTNCGKTLMQQAAEPEQKVAAPVVPEKTEAEAPQQSQTEQSTPQASQPAQTAYQSPQAGQQPSFYVPQPTYKPPQTYSQSPQINQQSQQAPAAATAAVSTDPEIKKGMAVLAYFSWLILIPLLLARKNAFARFHINQALVLFLISTVGNWLANLIGELLLNISPYLTLAVSGLFGIIGLIVFVLGIIGIINALQGKMKPLPIIGSIRILK